MHMFDPPFVYMFNIIIQYFSIIIHYFEFIIFYAYVENQ